MKKTAIALAIAGLATVSIAQAAPQQDTFYVGAKAGWASLHDGIKYSAENNMWNTTYDYNRNSVAYGLFAGYQFFNQQGLGLAAELGYDNYGQVEAELLGQTLAKHTNHGAQLTLKGSYSVLNGLDVYARAGAALVRSDYKAYGAINGQDYKTHSLKVSPVFAAGFEYNLPSTPELALRLEYQWVNQIGELEILGAKQDYTPSAAALTLGLSYRFGQSPVAPEVVNKTFNLTSDVAFEFAKANLTADAKTTLDGVYGEIAQVNNANVAVAGYTDSIGSDKANLKLSQKRAESVANYLVSKGVDAQSVSVAGYGEANPVTGATCDAVKGRQALIACLAPDRRVEIAVSGTK